MDLSVIIVNWNSAAYLEKCLETVFANNTGDLAFEVVVVNNSPADPCQDIVEKYAPQVRLLESQENLGFSGANNLGAKYGRGRHFLFLNPDTEIVGPALAELVSFLDRTPDAGLAGPKLLNSDLSVQTSCIQSFPSILNQAFDSERLRGIFPAAGLWGTRPLWDGSVRPVPVDVIAGACLMIKADVFAKIGGFDEGYFMYAEDVDLCFATKQIGYENYFVPCLQVIHHGGRSSDTHAESFFAAIVMRESVLRFLRKRKGPFYGAAYRSVMAATALLRIGLLAALTPTTPERLRQCRKVAFRRWVRLLCWTMGREKWASQLKRENTHENQNIGPQPDAYCAGAKTH